MSSSYSRNTELRHVQSKDLFKLAVILDVDNYWQTLMEIIPKQINNQTFGTSEDLEKISKGVPYERKYNIDHIRLIEKIVQRPGESRLCSQILFDEWSTSGRKHERPTLGVLMHLLVQSKLFRAADFVAALLNEPEPSRPNEGPAAEFEFNINVFKDIEETVNNTRFYPNTEELQENANTDINKDYFIKYNVDKKIPPINDNTEEPKCNIPIPPPRHIKTARLLKQEISQKKQLNVLQETANKSNTNTAHSHHHYEQENSQSSNESALELSSVCLYNLPKLSALLNTTSSETTTTNLSSENEILLPNISALNNDSKKISQNEGGSSSNYTSEFNCSSSTEESVNQHSDLNSIPIVVLSNSLSTGQKYDNNGEVLHEIIPIKALNLNGEKDEAASKHDSSNVIKVPGFEINPSAQKRNYADGSTNYEENCSRYLPATIEDYTAIEHERDNDVDLEDDEDSIPNLSFLDNRSSNNESSLTSVTNTSGDNSFEQSVNDCSSTSMDNIPILSMLNQ